jgi:TolA-binding protein
MRIKLSFLLITLIMISSVFAQEQKSADKIREKLKLIKEIKVTTAVAGIRGAEEKNSDELYWAGKEAVTKEELDLFKSAFDRAEKGEKEQAKSAFEEFLLKYPKSPLAKDAHEMMAALK